MQDKNKLLIILKGAKCNKGNQFVEIEVKLDFSEKRLTIKNV